jgi:hypothetical protein
MHPASARAAEDSDGRFTSLSDDFSKLCAAGLNIDMTRGKPGAAQLDLSNAILGQCLWRPSPDRSAD